MKKLISIILATALVMCLPLTALANNEQRTDFSYTHTKIEPSFTVSIPGALDLRIGDNYLDITVSNMANLGQDHVVVYVADSGNPDNPGLVDYRNIFCLYDPETGYFVRYQVYDMYDKEVTNDYNGNPRDFAINKKLADFFSNNIFGIRISLDPEYINKATHLTSGTYTGYITFGITLNSVYQTLPPYEPS